MTGIFGMFEIVFFLMFFLVIGVFIFIFAKGIREWTSNNNSPTLSVPAKIVDKNAITHRHHNHHSHLYRITFEVESGDRMELAIPRGEFGLLVVGDRGKLTFKGTRYLGFEREI